MGKANGFNIFEKRENVLFLRPDGKFILVKVEFLQNNDHF